MFEMDSGPWLRSRSTVNSRVKNEGNYAMGGGRNQTLPEGARHGAVGHSMPPGRAGGSGVSADRPNQLDSSYSGEACLSIFCWGANFNNSAEATVARKLGKWLTVVPRDEEETAQKGLNKKEIASTRHNQPRPGMGPNGFLDGGLQSICVCSDLIRNGGYGQVVVLLSFIAE
jgi:hypothetical protein